MKAGALLAGSALGLVLALSGCTGTSTPTSSSAADPEALAQDEAAKLLGLVTPPPESQEVDEPPVSVEDDPPQQTSTDDLVTRTRWWTVPMSPADALDFVQHNAVQGLDPSGTGQSSGPDPADDLTYVIFDAQTKASLSSETLLLSVASDGKGGAAIRADAQVVWLPVRSPDEAIPPDIDRIDVSAYGGIPDNKLVGHRTLSGAAARRLAAVINTLPTALRGDHGCAADFGYTLRVVAGPLTFVQDVACRDILVTREGRSLPTLGGDGFTHAVASSMGLPDYPSRRRISPARLLASVARCCRSTSRRCACSCTCSPQQCGWVAS